jgi:uncharacterized protein DUF1579
MRQIRVAACGAGLMALVLANVVLAQAPPMPKAGPEQRRLHYFVGQWKHEGEMKSGPFGPGGKFTSTEDVHMLGDFWVVFHAKGTGPTGATEELSSIGYDPKRKAYTYDDFNSMGQHVKSTGHVSGKTWTWMSDEDMGGKNEKGKFVLNEVSATSYTYKLDYSSDNGKTWANMFEGKATKVK